MDDGCVYRIRMVGRTYMCVGQCTVMMKHGTGVCWKARVWAAGTASDWMLVVLPPNELYDFRVIWPHQVFANGCQVIQGWFFLIQSGPAAVQCLASSCASMSMERELDQLDCTVRSLRKGVYQCLQGHKDACQFLWHCCWCKCVLNGNCCANILVMLRL